MRRLSAGGFAKSDLEWDAQCETEWERRLSPSRATETYEVQDAWIENFRVRPFTSRAALKHLKSEMMGDTHEL